MTTITKERAIEALYEAVAEKGADYVYVNPAGEKANEYNSIPCRYADDDGNPSCIVGHVLKKLDPEAFELAVKREAHIGGFSAGLLVGIIGEIRIDDGAAQVLRAAQRYQDNGKTWAEAVEHAKEVAGA